MKPPKEFRNPFPRWLVGDDPTLAHAEENSLFVAFATWRRRAGFRIRFDFASWHNSGLLIGIGMWLGVMVLRWSPAAGVTLMAITVLLYAYAWKIYSLSGARAVAMPRYAYFVYGQVLNRAVASELALVPLKPLELGRALYLELRASQPWLQLVGIIILSALLLRSPVRDLVIDADGTEPGHAFVFAARVLLLFAALRFGWWSYAAICGGFVAEYLRGHIPDQKNRSAKVWRALLGFAAFIAFMLLGGVVIAMASLGRASLDGLLRPAMELLASALPDLYVGTRRGVLLERNVLEFMRGLYDLALAGVVACLAVVSRRLLDRSVRKMDALSQRYSELSLEELVGEEA